MRYQVMRRGAYPRLKPSLCRDSSEAEAGASGHVWVVDGFVSAGGGSYELGEGGAGSEQPKRGSNSGRRVYIVTRQ